jgi:adenylate cyclase
MLGLSHLRRFISRGAFLGIVCASFSGAVSLLGPFRGMEEGLFDGWFYARGQRPTKAKVILVGLDDLSLDQIGKPLVFLSPELAQAVTCLKQHGAAAIGLDLIVPQSLEHNGTFARFLEADQLGQAIVEANNVVLAKRLLQVQDDGRHDVWLLPLTQWRFKALSDRATPTDLGFVNLTEDPDQFFRRQQLFGPEGDLHFALALYSAATGQAVRWQQGLWVGSQRVPLDADDRLVINFVGPPGSFPVLPFQDVLAAARDGRPLDVDVAGAIVIIGGSTKSLQDFHATPYGNKFYHRLLNDDLGLMSGPELHGHIIATLTDRAYIRSLPWSVALAFLLGLGALLGHGYGSWNLEQGGLLAVVFLGGYMAFSFAMFQFFHLRVGMVAVLLLGVSAYGTTFALRWRRQRRMLGIVKSEAIARVLEADARPLQLKGETRVVTVLFADIRGFTDFSEHHTPQQVVALLNAYFSAIVPIIEEQGGTLMQYIGDGVMVTFGAPAAVADHALRAVQTAVAIVRCVHERHSTWTDLNHPAFRIGVGIHTGEVVVGTVGSPRRLDYTAIGDTVNAAERIEAENKRLGSEILLSAQTYAALPEAERKRLDISAQAEPVQVKGKRQVLELYRIDLPAKPATPTTGVAVSIG